MNTYLLLKALHIISVIAWMAGIFYLPRLFAYHARATLGSEMDLTFRIMERRLLKIIINPSMIATFIFGIALIMQIGLNNLGGWFHVKALCVLLLAAFHGMLVRYYKDFLRGQNQKSQRFFRIINEIPPVLMIIIVLMAVLKPF